MGNLTRDPEMRTTPNGQNVVSFSVATNRSWQDQNGERKDSVEYHDVVAWGKLAELVNNYLKKGRKVLVVGRLQTRSWEAQDGAKRQKTEIVANDINFVDRMSEGGGDFGGSDDMNQEPKQDKSEPKAKKGEEIVIEDMGEGDINLDDIPF